MVEPVHIGIDLGTTYSSISYKDTQSPLCKLVKENNNASSFSSYIVITKTPSDKLSYLFGQPAKDQGGPYAFYESKRLIGKTYAEYELIGSEKTDWMFDVDEDAKGYVQMVIANPVDNNKQEKFYPEEVSAMVLMELMKLARTKIGESTPIGNVVVTIPVKFTPAQRNATIRACKIAGLENVELINEPSAAIIEYKRYIEIEKKKGTLKEGMKILVIDFGGGTLDVCCCQIGRKQNGETNVQVIRTGGDQDLGGKHFDEVIRDIIREQIEKDYPDAVPLLTVKGSDPVRVRKAKNYRLWKMLIEAEKAKIELSKKTVVPVSLGTILGADFVEEYTTVSREDFEKRCAEKLVTRFQQCVERILQESNLTKDQIDLVLPIGGSCCIPMVRNTIDKMFPDMNKRADPLFDSLAAVANGAAYQAFQYNAVGIDGDETIVETLQHSISTEIIFNLADFFVKKGDTLPARCEKTYYKCTDTQTEVPYGIYLGEEKFVTDPGMKSLKKMIVSVPPNTKREDFGMKTIFTITKSGLIHLEVTKEKGGKDLGKLDVKLEMNVLDDIIVQMRNHILQYCGN